MDPTRSITFLILLFIVKVKTEKCGSSIYNPSLTWNKGHKGDLQFLIPGSTQKWKVEMTFDSAVNSITAWQGTKEKCVTNKKRCVFENESWNGKKELGDELKLGYQINHDVMSTPPRMTKVLLKYCDTTPCSGWKKVVICQGISSPDTLTSTTEITTVNSEEIKSENILVNGNFENEELVGWECNGCSGSIVSPGYNSESSYQVQQRKASWAGPRQQVPLDMISSQNSRFKFGYSIQTDSSIEMRWKLKVCNRFDNNSN